jgi:hypothetical protein
MWQGSVGGKISFGRNFNRHKRKKQTIGKQAKKVGIIKVATKMKKSDFIHVDMRAVLFLS